MKNLLLIVFSIFALLTGAQGKEYYRSSAASHSASAELSQALHHQQTFIVNPVSSSNDWNFEVEATEDEIEEHKLIPAKKYGTAVNFASALIWVLILGYFSSYLKKGFALKEHLNHSPSIRRFVLLEVFRL